MSRQTIQVIDTHAAGEPGRVVIDQHMKVKGKTMAERLINSEKQLDDLRRLILNEPRGYPGLCAPLILPPVNEDSDFGLVVMEQGGFRPMSGSNLICSVTALIESKLVKVTEPVTELRVDTAAGTVLVKAEVRDGRAQSVTFQNVPAFVVELDRVIDVPEYGKITADIVFGGQFYVQAKADQFGLELRPHEAKKIIRAASALVNAAHKSVKVQHPTTPEINSIGLPMLWAPSDEEGVDARNAVVLPNGTVDLKDPETWTGTLDRSPCGTGTSGRLAAKYARGELKIGDPFVHQSMLGTTFTGQIIQETEIAGMPAIVPAITGKGWVTGYNQLILDSDDPFQTGYTLGDIWGIEYPDGLQEI